MLRLYGFGAILALTSVGVAACGSSDDGQGAQSFAGTSGSSTAGNRGSAGQGGSSTGHGGQAGSISSGNKAGSAAAAADGGSGGTRSGTGGAAGSAQTGAQAGTGGGAASSNPTTQADPSDEIYDPDALPRFDIDLPAASISALDANPDAYATGTLHYNGETLENVGVRIKGEATKRTLDKKAAFKLKFDEFVDKQEFHGLRRLTLNNMLQDTSQLAERLAFHLFRAAKLPAPRANSALVYVNGEYYGVYANVEAEDKPFLRRWFSSDAGNLYEEGQSDFLDGRENTFDLETNETKNDRTDLKTLIDALMPSEDTPESFLTDVGASLDTAHFLKYAAVEAAVDQWDGYAYTFFEPNNFRIYDDPSTGKFVFLPWGMDLSLKPFPYTDHAHIGVFELSHYEDKASERISNGIIFQRCLKSTSCKAMYTPIVRDTAQLFDDQKLDTLAARYYAQIKQHVYEDTRKEVSNSEFDAGYQSLLQTIETRTAAIRKDLGQ